MKTLLIATIVVCLLEASSPSSIAAADKRQENLVILTTEESRNLGIETVMALPRTFEETVFAIGRIEERPDRRALLSSRIAGKVSKLEAFIGDTVNQGDALATIESRQPGNPPPTVILKAPASGRITESLVSLGQPVEPDKPLLTIADHSELWAVARIPEKSASFITNGTPARIRIPALGGEIIRSTFLRQGVTADADSGTVQGVFTISNPEDRLRPGMRVEFSIVVSSRDNVLSLPREAIQGDRARPLIFIKDFELPNAFLKAPVRLGVENDQFVEILGGLFPGDDVVVEGAYSLNFAGGGSLSLKEALDAAHGHEHNEDGSEITPEQRKEEEGNQGSPVHGPPSRLSKGLQVYSIAITLVAMVLFQQLWSRRRDSGSETTC